VTAGDRRRIAARAGIVGAVLLIIAGLVQTTLGTVIPDWTGDKREPVALGLLSVALGTVAAVAARRPRSGEASAGIRLAWALALVGPGLLGLSTVGVLGWVPAILLTSAGILAVADEWRGAVLAVSGNAIRVLISALGACQLLMAAGAAPLLMIIGGLGGAAMISSAWLRSAPTGPRIGIVLLGLLPFAGAGWTAIGPPLVALVAAPLLLIVVRQDLTGPSLSRSDPAAAGRGAAELPARRPARGRSTS
jgi:hypothetical protein